MATADLLNWLEENGPASKQEIAENSDLSRRQVNRNIPKIGKWEDYYNISIDESGKRNIYDVEKKNVSNQKGFSMRI